MGYKFTVNVVGNCGILTFSTIPNSPFCIISLMIWPALWDVEIEAATRRSNNGVFELIVSDNIKMQFENCMVLHGMNFNDRWTILSRATEWLWLYWGSVRLLSEGYRGNWGGGVEVFFPGKEGGVEVFFFFILQEGGLQFFLAQKAHIWYQ